MLQAHSRSTYRRVQYVAPKLYPLEYQTDSLIKAFFIFLHYTKSINISSVHCKFFLAQQGKNLQEGRGAQYVQQLRLLWIVKYFKPGGHSIVNSTGGWLNSLGSGILVGKRYFGVL